MPFNDINVFNDDVWNNQPTDATSAQGWSSNISNDLLNTSISITKGKWRLVCSNPNRNGVAVDAHAGTFNFVDDSGSYQSKAYTLDKVTYDFEKNETLIDITVKENPIPLFVVWGTVAVVVFIVGAISVNSVLKRVESLASDTGITDITKGIGEQLRNFPFIWPLVIIGILGVIALPYFKRKL